MKKVIISAAAVVLAIAFGVAGAFVYSQITKVCDRETEETIREAESYASEGDYYNAICTYDQNMKYDLSKELSERRKETFKTFADQLMESSYDLIRQYNYSDAAEILKSAAVVDDGDYPAFTKLYETCKEFQNYTAYTGTIDHITFRPVIAYPEMAFVGDDMQDYLKNTFVTAGEFKRALEKFYENDYVLIDIRNVYGVDGAGEIYKKEVYVPLGKKPLVLSIDDLSYYDYMRRYGMVTGMEVGGDGKTIVSYTETPKGRVYSDDNDVVPIVENMIKEHPDFSWGLAKGTIALTGREGVLGYRTNETHDPDYAQRVADAQNLAEVLKENGWNFACKGYGDIDPSLISTEEFCDDLDRWIKEVEPIIGKTDIYAYPTVETLKESDDKFQYMIKQGFRMFLALEEKPALRLKKEYAFMQRRGVDGRALANDWMNNLIDFTGVADKNIRK